MRGATRLLGIIDEYHGARYSSGFLARMRADIASASTTRPELAAFLTHLDMEDSDDPDTGDADDPGTGEPDDSEWEARGADHDFRAGRAERHLKYLDEARDFARRMMEGEIGWPPPTTAVQRTPLSLVSVVGRRPRLDHGSSTLNGALPVKLVRDPIYGEVDLTASAEELDRLRTG